MSKAPSFPKELSVVLPALWGLRFAVHHEHGALLMGGAKTLNPAWLSLVGECVLWPSDLLQRFIQEDTGESEPVETKRRTRRHSKRLQIQWQSAYQAFSEAFTQQPDPIIQCFERSIESLEAYCAEIRDQDTVWQNVQLLSGLLNLKPLEQTILLYLVCISDNRAWREFLSEMEFVSVPKAAKILASMFKCTDAEFIDAIHPKQVLVANGLISKSRHYPDWSDFIDLSDKVKTALIYPNFDLNEMMQHFTHKSSPGHLVADDMPHMQDSLKLLTQVVSQALVRRERGINILLYGMAGTGKTEFAKLLAQHVGACLYEVSFTDQAGESADDRERYISLLMAQKFLSARNDTLLLFDEVEEVLENSGSSEFFDIERGREGTHRFSKAWVNEKLENNPVPTLWICNQHRRIDQAHLRRFLFHIEFRVPPRSVRQRIVERYFQDFNIPENSLKKLSMNTAISPAQLETTSRLLKLSGCNNPIELETLLNQSIHNSLQVMGYSDIAPPKTSLTPYRLDYLNVDSQVPMSRLLRALQQRPGSSLCFYGPPGTGKTQLAEYLAEQLDKPLVVKRASDLLSKWLGESEQNIAAMFKEARDERAILLLDEADSFLRDRQGMSKSWEVSQVNELLQQMECFDGIFICATNLFEQLDQAALRRFAFKIRFDYLTLRQRLELFAESLQCPVTSIADAHQKRLSTLETLTPGDFATVLRQSTVLGEQPLASEMLHQLEIECSLKNGGRTQRTIGFI